MKNVKIKKRASKRTQNTHLNNGLIEEKPAVMTEKNAI